MLSLTIICSTFLQCAVLCYGSDRISFPDEYETGTKSTNSYYPHHHHRPESRFHHTAEYHQTTSDRYKNATAIPIELIMKYNNFEDVDDLIANLVEGSTIELAGRFGAERNPAMMPKSAVCKPELQTVKIAATDDPSVLYLPSCTRIERCGGCCPHNLLSCQPVDIDTVSFQVIKTQFQGGSKLRVMAKEVVLIERHVTCNCSCKVQPKDCNHFQKYNKHECRCGCTNTDEEKKCQKEHAIKLWNPELCACQCKTMMQCSTGYTYDTFKCKCVPVLMRRRNAEIAINKIERYEPLPVLPLYDNEEN